MIVEVGGGIEPQLFIVQRPHICCNPPKATEKTNEQSTCAPTLFADSLTYGCKRMKSAIALFRLLLSVWKIGNAHTCI